VGIIADRDIALRCLAGEQITAETTAEQVMSPEMLYCRDTDTTDDVTKLMTANNLQQLAVLDSSKRLVGMVTLGDLSKHLNFEIKKTVAQKYHYVARKPVRAAAQKLVEEAGAIADGDPVRLAEKRISDCREAAKKAETQFWREVLIDLIWLEQTPPEIPMIEDGDRP
jgi:CBS-domain-containing membrane protein